MTEITQKEIDLRYDADRLRQIIALETEWLVVLEKAIKELEQGRCAHKRPVLGDEVYVYCADCGKPL